MFNIELSECIDLTTNFGVREGETVYDFAWFPSMNSQGLSELFFFSLPRSTYIL